MIEVPASAITGSLRVGLQVVSNYKRPVLEVYHQVCNRFGPEQEFDVPNGSNGAITKHKTRFQDIFIQFTLINIGGVRAENLNITIEGDLKRNPPREIIGGLINQTIAQFAPGQSQFLFKFNNHDLLKYAEGGGLSLGLKNQTFTLNINYDAPPGIINWLLSLPNKLRGKKRFHTSYTFSPSTISGDLPPPEYVA